MALAVAEQYDRFQRTLEALEKPAKYLNYGYTTDSSQSYESRQEALCLKVFEAAEVKPHHRLIDVGFGSGEQDFLWARRFDFASLQGFNISSRQVRYAQERAEARGQRHRLQFHQGRAEHLPGLAPESADRLLAVECAFYFDRRRFYQRAAQVLRPGGLLVAADISFSRLLEPATWLREDLQRVGTLGSNQELWRQGFRTRQITPIHGFVLPGVRMTVREIERTLPGLEDPKERAQWQSMAFWSRLVALGLRTRALRYDLIVLERNP